MWYVSVCAVCGLWCAYGIICTVIADRTAELLYDIRIEPCTVWLPPPCPVYHRYDRMEANGG